VRKLLILNKASLRAKAKVKVYLLPAGNPIRRAKVNDLPWPATLREIAGILNKSIPWPLDPFLDVEGTRLDTLD